MAELRFKVAPVWKGTYSVSTQYDIADEVRDPDGTGNYRSLVGHNKGNALSDTTKWLHVMDLTELHTTVEAASAVTKTANENEALRESNERSRVSAETTRSQNEAIRVENEQGRISSETSRRESEENRRGAENTRTQNESIRVSSESSRENAEKQRSANESTRQDNERVRETAEQARQDDKTGEAYRIANESMRVENENARILNETQRQSAEGTSDDTPNPTGSRWARYKQAEADRTTVFDNTQASRQTAYNTAEGTPTDAANATGSRWARFNKAEQDRNALVEEKVSIITDLTEDVEGLKSGDIPAAVATVADNISSWADRDSLTVEDTWDDVVRTTAGDQSIDSSKAARLVSIVAKTDFSATSLVSTGFNLLSRRVVLTNGYYLLVPALTFGSFGTATQPNGILFTSSNGTNLKPTVRFRKLSEGVPTGISDGTACTYTDSNGYRFFTTPEAGYMIVTESTAPATTTCAHIGWSRRYNDYVATGTSSDAGTVLALTSILNAVHSDVKKLLTVGSDASLVSDQIVFDSTRATWTRRVQRVKPTWTTTENPAGEGEETTYKHTATISAIKSNGLAEFETLDADITVEGTSISYTDGNNTATDDYVKYELATTATGNVTISPVLNVEDWGLEYFAGVTGTAFVTTAYAQNYPDSVAALLSSIDSSTIPVISKAIAYLSAQIDSLKRALFEERISLVLRSVDAEDYYTVGVPNVLVSGVAGAPSASVVPDNWDEKAMGFWTGVPRFIGQVYIDQTTTGTKVYLATKITDAVSDWTVLN